MGKLRELLKALPLFDILEMMSIAVCVFLILKAAMDITLAVTTN